MIDRYYEAELRYLREAGKEFAQAHPERAAALNLDRFGPPDPYVERLFEGFAFLAARLHQRLDDDLPELTEGVVGLLWPHYVRTIPSLAILELQPKPFVLRQVQRLPRGLAVRSAPVGPAGVRCQYRSTQPVALAPLRLVSAEGRVSSGGRSVISLGFEIEPQVAWNQLGLETLRLYLHADMPVALALRRHLLDHVGHVVVRSDDGPARRIELDGAHRFRAVGFGADERLWPSASTSFAGYELLQEYFAFREKFLFVDLCGLEALGFAAQTTRFTVEAVLDKAFPADLPFDADNIRLHCTPIVNLFDLEAEPIRVDFTRDEYRLVPMLREADHVETYSVDDVLAFDHASGRRLPYVPFSSFKHRGGLPRGDSPERYFHARPRRSPSGRHEVWLALGGHAGIDPAQPPAETLSVRMTGTNGLLPRKALRDAGITELVAGSPDLAGCRNLTAPTLPQYPPTDDRFHWRLISHLIPSFLSLIDAEVLRSTLALYDWNPLDANRRRIEGIVDARGRAVHRPCRGAVVAGHAIEVDVLGSHFAGEGDLHLFGGLLSEFLRLYVPVNSFAELTLVVQPAGTRLSWRCDFGALSPL
ncbi:type VI secretion system baseplate subunit TssF [Aquincola sp. MAHUQ-54]|uniref:Type VI secretion system baseplate subunit TssF n=1 Tax=Aquincola agrisoli TaxID=3119538 RepID=A0AAW9Q6Q4_9BURK